MILIPNVHRLGLVDCREQEEDLVRDGRYGKDLVRAGTLHFAEELMMHGIRTSQVPNNDNED